MMGFCNMISGIRTGGVYAGILDGTAGGYFSTPDSAALDITGDIDLRADCAMNDWTPGTASVFIAKFSTTGAYRFYIETTGALVINWVQANGSSITKTSTATMPTANGGRVYIRVTLDVDNGAGGNDVKFYTSPDGAAWTQLGATVTTAGVTNIRATTDVLELGGDTLGVNRRLSGKIYSAQVYNGIAGTLVANFQPYAYPGAGTALVAPTTGETWTINGTASIARVW
jgi:hypothetical protein